jgi:phospho-N-acetylmuramoyl-pentapeptide-transferase
MGTPTAGGIVILVALVAGYVVTNVIFGGFTPAGMSLILATIGFGAVGFLDDFIKVHRRRSLGLSMSAKFIGTAIVSLVFAFLVVHYSGSTGTSTQLSFIRETPIKLGIAFYLWAFIILTAASHSVNLTDGLDGLATGTSVMVFASYVLIGIWQFGQNCARATAPVNCYEVRDPLDLAVVAAAVMGACFGFLWWNASPAAIFMGDTGSLSLGGALAGLAIFTRTELLLVILGGLLVIEVMSVILQVGFFKMTRGRRLFKMSPIHHHFELLNWAQVTIVMRFWIIAGLCVAAGLGIFYAEWVAGT